MFFCKVRKIDNNDMNFYFENELKFGLFGIVGIIFWRFWIFETLGTFELLFVTMNVEDFVENLNIRLHLPEGEAGQNQNSSLPIDDEKYNQIRNNLEIIVKSLSEDDQNKIRELFEKKDTNLLNILESEVNDIEKAKKSILNFLGKN